MEDLQLPLVGCLTLCLYHFSLVSRASYAAIGWQGWFFRRTLYILALLGLLLRLGVRHDCRPLALTHDRDHIRPGFKTEGGKHVVDLLRSSRRMSFRFAMTANLGRWIPMFVCSRWRGRTDCTNRTGFASCDDADW